MTLVFYANNQNLSLTPSQKGLTIASHSKKYLVAKFIPQSLDWKKESLIYVLFRQNGKTYKKYLGIEEGLEANECYVPTEVLFPGAFEVSLFSENGISTNKLIIQVQDSGYTEDIENQESTPSTLEQMNTLFYNYASLCNEILKECEKIKKDIGGNK